MQVLIHISYQRRQVVVHVCVHRAPHPPLSSSTPKLRPKPRRLFNVWGGLSPCTTSSASTSLGSLCHRCCVHVLCGLVIAVTLATALNNNISRDVQLDVIVSGRRSTQPRTTLDNNGGQGYQAQDEGIGGSVSAHLKHYRSKIRTNLGRNELVDINRRDVSEIEELLTELPVTETTSTTSTTTTTTVTTTSKSLPQAGAVPSSVIIHPNPMSPVHENDMDTMGSNVVVFVLVLALVLATLGVLTCILSTYRYRTAGGAHHHHHRAGPRGGSSWSHSAADMPSDAPGLLGSNANLPMLALPGGMCAERLNHDRAAMRDRHVRLKSVQTDTELDLPPSIPLPDGEEKPYGCSTRLHIRDPLQESEIYQKCVRAPPNRTVYDGESPPPYRSSSAGLLSHCVAASGSSDWSSSSDGVVRCHSMSSHASSAPASSAPPAVHVPSRSRRLSAFTEQRTGGVLAHLTMVPCLAERQRRPTPPPSQSV